jgi:hypothetical protein
MKPSSKIWESLTRGVRELSPTCREATRLQSDALDKSLPWRQRFGLFLHLLICKWCRRYGRHLGFLRTAAKKCAEFETEPPERLSPAARERIRQALNKETDGR